MSSETSLSTEQPTLPLTGVRVVELGGIGPGPFTGMMLADLGAEVIRLDRPGSDGSQDMLSHQVLLRGRRSLALDLKKPEGVEIALRLSAASHAVFEGFRPGVAERLGIGPKDIHARNPRVVYGRMTGWGQDGPMAHVAGHDINYLAVSGALHPLIGADRVPSPPLNMLGDFGGGGMLLAFGLLAGLLEARTTGVGRVVDAAIVDGVALQTAMLHAMRNSGGWSEHRGTNLFDGGAPFYRAYETSDGQWMAVGAVEPKFYARLIHTLQLDEVLRADEQYASANWELAKVIIGDRFKSHSQSEWVEIFDGVDACVTPVIAPWDVLEAHGGIGARSYEYRGFPEPRPAPRFDGVPAPTPPAYGAVGSDSRRLLQEIGYNPQEIEQLVASGVTVQS
ncbi:CaiB/BaiF CoA transferase family protein [Rhodococcus aetherivorans]